MVSASVNVIDVLKNIFLVSREFYLNLTIHFQKNTNPNWKWNEKLWNNTKTIPFFFHLISHSNTIGFECKSNLCCERKSLYFVLYLKKFNFMKTKLFLFLTFIMVYPCFSQNMIQTDICIYGGTSAGVIAAYSAKMSGKSVLLIEPGKHLGGLTTGGLGATDIGNKYAVTGLSRDFYRRLGKEYNQLESWLFEPKVAEKVFNDYIKEANVQVIFNTRILGAKVENAKIVSIECENSLKPDKITNTIISAKVFIDCSYEGDLMAKSGVGYTFGREDKSVYNEEYNGVFFMPKNHQFPDGVDPYRIKGYKHSGLLYGISDEKMASINSGDKKIQAYNFRLCLSFDPTNQIKIYKPENYDSTNYELWLRINEIQPYQSIHNTLIIHNMPNSKTDMNNNGGFSTDFIGMNWNYAEADYATRIKIIKMHEDYTKGFLYFLANDSRVPAHIRAGMNNYGYPKDEYLDNGNFSHQLYIRESRRMIGEYVMTEHNCLGKISVEDGIGLAAYTMDSHNCQRIVLNGQVKNEGNMQRGEFPPYPISYRSLIPKQKECTNLLVPVCLSASHAAYGSIRMEPVFMVLSQVAGYAAVQAIDSKRSVQNIDVNILKSRLIQEPLAQKTNYSINLDDSDPCVQKSGEWIEKEYFEQSYGKSYLIDLTKDKPKYVRFQPEIKKTGKYALYWFATDVEGKSKKLNFNIQHEKGLEKVSLDNLPPMGYIKNEWIKIGEYTFQKGKNGFVEITNQNADGFTTADGMVFIYIP